MLKVTHIIGLFTFFLILAYIVANIHWFNNIEGVLYIETDPIFPFTSFLPPYIHNCCGDHYIEGWNQQKITLIGYKYILGIILSSIILTIVSYKPTKKILKGLENDLLKA